jgi:hypothetical protein
MAAEAAAQDLARHDFFEPQVDRLLGTGERSPTVMLSIGHRPEQPQSSQTGGILTPTTRSRASVFVQHARRPLTCRHYYVINNNEFDIFEHQLAPM